MRYRRICIIFYF